MKKIIMIGVGKPQRTHNIPGPTPVPKSTPAPRTVPASTPVPRQVPAYTPPTSPGIPVKIPKREKVGVG
jgi:hypothetical protein